MMFSTLATDRKTSCRVAFEMLREDAPDVFGEQNFCVYDLQAILFTLNPLKVEVGPLRSY